MPMLFLIVATEVCAELLRDWIDLTDKFEVVGIATDGQSGLRQMERLEQSPDIVVLEVGAPLALETARALRARNGTIRVAALGLDEAPSTALAWAAVGANALIGRSAPLEELLVTLHGVAEGDAPCSGGVAAALLRGVAGLGETNRQEAPLCLTAREREVALLLADGLTNREMARRMHIELGTVKSHVHSVIGKLGVARRAQVAARISPW